jgi:hypothetical protein
MRLGGRWLPTFLVAGLLTACAPVPAALVCPESSPIWPTQPDCEDAIVAALEVWPSDNAPLQVITYRHDFPCPPGWECPAPAPTVGYVVFDYRGIETDVYAAVEDRDGELIVSELLPVPP